VEELFIWRNQMNEFKLGKDALILSIMTLITVLTWIIFEVYRTATKTTIPKVTQEQMAPLNSQIKKEIIEKLKENIWLSPEEAQSFSSSITSEARK
jgi:hypothetical protein